ncbi:hypothetical protein DL95DRAFT_417336 [Leptodontidium sp. 2 PMI_412]|nr:hypothetical protein DL95DRAFT_417336 [Leptodontidium sp. 2 PMI_412]
MKTISAILVLFTASAVSAQTFTAFPTTLKCELDTGVATFTKAEVEAVAAAGISGTPVENSAANASSGRCTTYRLPYFRSELGEGGSGVYYVFDSAANRIEFCGADRPPLGTGGGYMEPCTF